MLFNVEEVQTNKIFHRSVGEVKVMLDASIVPLSQDENVINSSCRRCTG